MDTLPDITPYEAAALMFSALQVVATLDAACVQEQPFSAPLPRGFISCGEAYTLIPALVVMLLREFPQLMDPEQFTYLTNTAIMHSAQGEPN